MLEKLTKDLINKFIYEIKKEENQQQIEFDIINPIFTKISKKIYPFVSSVLYMYVLNLILIIIIIVLILIIMFSNK